MGHNRRIQNMLLYILLTFGVCATFVTPGTIPPDIPAGPYFRLEWTSLRFTNMPRLSISHVANALYDFLNARGATIVKTSPQKFAIKIQILAPSLIHVKMRFYREVID